MSVPINKLYFGDCLNVMRDDIEDESVDLIYLDPPFNSKRIYNAFHGGAQWVAFNDTWHWSEAVDDFHDLAGSVDLADIMEGLRRILGEGGELAYLSYMANRLRECRRVLKPTGSIYLHCDPTMSHYLKLVMDGLFGKRNFQNEIIWHYQAGTKGNKRFGRKHDVIFFYSQGKQQFNRVSKPVVNPDRYNRVAEDGRRYDVNGQGKRYYLDEGQTCDDVWTWVQEKQFQQINSQAKEKLGFETQKPMALLQRIILASSNEGDTILDPFCGCGTTIHAAQLHHRQWIGIDVCVKACQVIEKRIREHFDSLWSDVQYIGMPKTSSDAKTLADLDKFKFEKWAASLVDGMEANKKQRGDKGIDGRGRIAMRKGEFIDIVSQVKGGSTSPGDVQAFNGARQEANAELGVFTCFEDRVTQRMRDAAASTGRFMDVPKVQIYTVEDFFEGRKPMLPRAA